MYRYTLGLVLLLAGMAIALAATEHAVARSVLALALLGTGSYVLAQAWETKHAR